jgi:hypothetical protein
MRGAEQCNVCRCTCIARLYGPVSGPGMSVLCRTECVRPIRAQIGVQQPTIEQSPPLSCSMEINYWALASLLAGVLTIAIMIWIATVLR